MNKENMDNVEKFIEENGVHPEIRMSETEIKRRVYKTMAENNAAFVLADAANSFFIDCEKGLSVLGKGFKNEQKMKFSRLKQAVRLAKNLSAEIADELYQLKDEEKSFALYDSDFYYNLIKLIEDRTGEDPTKAYILLEFLLGMPSTGLYDVKLDDFRWQGKK